ncbi:MAG: hypothetical protein AAF900_01495 [Bacteroidota bacterium]
MQLSSLGATHVNNISNAVLLGILCWLSSDYTKQLAQNPNNNENKLTFMLNRSHYILAGVVLTAMVAYIGYFFYQKYLVHKVPSYSLRKDVVIFALASFLASMFFYPAIAGQLQKEAQQHEKLTKTLLGKIIMSFIGYGYVYVVAIACIENIKSNRKIKIFNLENGGMWLFSIMVLTNIHTIMHLSTACNVPAQLLWAIPACFLYVQAYWSQQRLSSSNEKIDNIIAYLFHTSHLWEGLGCVFMLYYLDFPFYKIIGVWIAWKCCKYGLYHLDIKKISDTAGYTVSFPLGFTALLEGSFMILFVAFGLCDQLWPNALATPLTKILYGATILAISLLISLYATVQKPSIAQWGMLPSYGILSIGGSVMAGYYAWNADNQEILAISTGSLLVFGLYLVPKFLNLIATASLTLVDMPVSLRKIAHITRGFTSFWLQPNLEVLLAGIVMGVGLRFWGPDIAKYLLKEFPLGLIILILELGLGLLLYALLQVYFYNKAVLAEKKRALISHGLLGLYLGLLALFIKVNTLEKSNDLKTIFPPEMGELSFLAELSSFAIGGPCLFMVKYLICYVIVVLWVQILLDIVNPKDYKRTFLPLGKWKAMVTHAFRKYTVDMWPSMGKHLGSALATIKQYVICSLSVLLVGYCLYKREEISRLLFMSGLFVGLLYIFPKFMQLVATISLTWTSMPLSLQKLARGIQHATAFWLQPDLDIMLFAAVVMGIGCIYEYGDKGDMRSAQYAKALRFIGITYLLVLAAYLMIEVVYYHFSTQGKITGYLEFFVFGCALASIVELLDTGREDKIKCTLRTLYCFFCYIGIMVWMQSLLNIVGLKGYRKASILPSLTIKDMYAIALGFCNVLIQLGSIHWFLARDHDYVSLPMLLLVFAAGAYISLVKLVQSLKHKASIVSYGMVVAYYAYATSFLCNGEKLPEWFPKTHPFDQLSVVVLGLCAAIVVVYVQNIAIHKLKNFTLAKMQGMLYRGYTSGCQFFLRILVFLKALLSTEATSSALSTDVVSEEITTPQVDPLNENIKITLVKNFPAAFGLGMILLYNKYLLSVGSGNPMTSTFRLVMVGTVCGLAFLYVNVVLSEFDTKVGRLIFYHTLLDSFAITLAIAFIKFAISFSKNSIIAQVILSFLAFILGSIVVYEQRNLFYKKALHKWVEKFSGLTLLTCVTALHINYLFFIDILPMDTWFFMAKCIIYYCSSCIVLVSMLDTLQLSSVATTDTWKGWFSTHFCTYWPGILSLSYVMGFHIWQTPILPSNQQKIVCSLFFLLLFGGFKQLKVTAQEEGKLRFSPIAIDHNLLAKDLFMAFLLPVFYHISQRGPSNLSQVSYQDVAMSMLCTIVVRWGLCNGLITHLTKKQAEKSSRRLARLKQSSNTFLWMRRAVHGILVVTCWLLMKRKIMSQITTNSLLILGVVTLAFLSAYSKEIAYFFDIKYIKRVMAFFYDVFYHNQNQIVTFLIMAWLQKKLFVSDADVEDKEELRKQLKISAVIVCIVLVINTIIQENYAKIFTHCIFWSFGLRGLMPLYEQESSTYILNTCYIVVVLAVEALHRVLTQGRVDDIKHGVLTRMHKHYLLLGALYGLGIAIAPGVYNENVDLFNYNRLICVMLGVLIGFVGAVYGKLIAVWLGEQDRIAWIQDLSIFVSIAIATRIQLGITIEEHSSITNRGNFLAIFIPFTLGYLYYLCALFMDKQQKLLCWLFRWSRADALVDYVPLASPSEHKS